MNSEKIGKFIATLRKERNMTQEELAHKLLVDRTMVSKWERGVYIPNAEFLLKLQEIFDVSINEILYGERKNLDNNDEIDTISINIMNNFKKKVRKILICSFVSALLFLLLFLCYYFIVNYNSIRVYKVYGDSEKFYVNDGIMILSKEKSYIKIGRILKHSDNKIKDTRLYFIKDNEEHNIFIGGEDDTELLLVNEFDYDELFKYEDVKYILKGLFLEITTNTDDKYTINLIIKKDFSNNNLITDKIKPIGEGENIYNKNLVPDYIKENYIYDKDKEEYYHKTTSGGYDITETYFFNPNVFVVIKYSNKLEQRFEYSDDDQFLNFYVFEKDNLISNFSYDLGEKKCISLECDSSIIEEFNNNYFNKIFN